MDRTIDHAKPRKARLTCEKGAHISRRQEASLPCENNNWTSQPVNNETYPMKLANMSSYICVLQLFMIKFCLCPIWRTTLRRWCFGNGNLNLEKKDRIGYAPLRNRSPRSAHNRRLLTQSIISLATRFPWTVPWLIVANKNSDQCHRGWLVSRE